EVLVADADAGTSEMLAALLGDAGYRVSVVSDGEQARAAIEARLFDVALVDVCLPKGDGLALLAHVHAVAPVTEVILMTGSATVPDAVASVRQGACDYLSKPFAFEALRAQLDRIEARVLLRRELEAARQTLPAAAHESVLVGCSPAMAQLR